MSPSTCSPTSPTGCWTPASGNGRPMNDGTKPAILTSQSQSLRDWLLAEAPSPRRKIAWGERYRSWRRFAANRLALGALIAIAVLILVAIAAPLLAPDNPYA